MIETFLQRLLPAATHDNFISTRSFAVYLTSGKGRKNHKSKLKFKSIEKSCGQMTVGFAPNKVAYSTVFTCTKITP